MTEPHRTNEFFATQLPASIIDSLECKDELNPDDFEIIEQQNGYFNIQEEAKNRIKLLRKLQIYVGKIATGMELDGSIDHEKYLYTMLVENWKQNNKDKQLDNYEEIANELDDLLKNENYENIKQMLSF
ncbi:hypothetical protein TVAG_002880 [Trichomonas vaginalis G3]|uniref:Uncharacterized protein n=1 Tax=Trichomonas vaginalis (strain ATCC PRA-98 / G3) TaxID=412133 RepID=A2EZR1_TRIV3|nr:hypothetical protein TVAGG3_0816300 [Trichomonas vaginalis G3]EAY01833.1 hypothetical protein TVAG_002880 [Trichomonas vaginalis G3]KAI5497557.1 hypothetical protein TVAGG3_0816300 [Trichomonas vaginalis G3]|eukprot:XP_001314380.1 hypothetical protein [Trichomonas vaginalis G3]